MRTETLKLVESAYANEETRWLAAKARDGSANGAFWVCVATTGVYCLPSCAGRPHRRNVSFVRTRREAETAGYRPCKRCRPERFVAGPLSRRISEIDWTLALSSLDAQGWARLGAILTSEECASLIDRYEDDAAFRSTVSMARHGFGEGEYRYFADRPPPHVIQLRDMLYPRFAPIAEKWAADLGRPRVFPPDHAAYRALCAAAGQSRPTPLILKYGPGGYNRLHQDLYGGEAFPIQVAVLLSEPGRDFEGGAFVLAEQRPRMQTRIEIAPLKRGDAIAFAVNERPVRGARGMFRVRMRHGVSTVTAGRRFALGVIFHDAA